MSRFTFNRKRLKLKKLLGIRARLALLALISGGASETDRARSLEGTRAKQIAQATQEFHSITERSVQAQREIIASVETMMKSAAYISASAGAAVGGAATFCAHQPEDRIAEHVDCSPAMAAFSVDFAWSA